MTEQKLLPLPKNIIYRVDDMPDGTFRLFVADMNTYLETEEALVENVIFQNVPDLLKFIGLHYPGAKEEFTQ